MRDQNGLVLVPSHRAQKMLAGRDHMLLRRIIVRRPIQTDMLDWIFRGTATRANTGLLFEKLGILG